MVSLCVHVVGVFVRHVCACVGVVVCVCCVWLVWRDGVWVPAGLEWPGAGGCGVDTCMCVVVVVFVGACVVVCVRCGVMCVAMLCGRGRRRWLVWMHVYCVD